MTSYDKALPHRHFVSPDKDENDGVWIGREVETPWESGLKVTDSCGIHSKDWKPSVEMSSVVYHKINAMNHAMESKEWLGYLVGIHQPEQDIYQITNILVPEQVISYSNVEVTDEAMVLANVIGSVHWHHNMGAFFSKTDEDSVGANHDIMIVTSKRGWKAQVRKVLPCGHFLTVEATIHIQYPPPRNLQQFVDTAKAKLTVKTYTPTAPKQPIQVIGGRPIYEQGFHADAQPEIVPGTPGSKICGICQEVGWSWQMYKYEDMDLCVACYFQFRDFMTED